MTLPTGSNTSAGRAGRGLAQGDGEVRGAHLQLASLREDLAELNAAYGDGKSSALVGLVTSLEIFLRRLGRRNFELAPHEVPALRKGETLRSAIENRRRRLRELEADRKSVRLAPLPSSLSKEKARAQIAELAKRGRPVVFGLVERGLPIEWPTLPVAPASQELSHIILNQVDTAGLIAWALGPALVAAIDREIDDLSDDERALTAEQRRGKTEEIAADMLAVEREEEALIEAALAEGLQVSRRYNADPRAVLGIVSRIAPERANAA